MANVNWIKRINLKLYLFITLLVLAIALLTYYNPIHFAREGFQILGEYDYVRTFVPNQPPSFYRILIHPSPFGYIHTRRTVRAAAADLALRLGYEDMGVIRTRRARVRDGADYIEVEVFLYSRRRGESPPVRARRYNALAVQGRERFPIFLTQLI